MTASPPPVDLDALEEALAAATPGPWAVHPQDASEVVGMWKPPADDEDDDWEGVDVCGTRTPIPGTMYGDSAAEDANAAAIVAAVNATPALIAELRDLRAKVAAVEALANRWESVPDHMLHDALDGGS